MFALRAVVPPLFWCITNNETVSGCKIPISVLDTNEEVASPEYANRFSILTNTDLKRSFSDFLRDVGVRDDLIFIEGLSGDFSTFKGNNWFTFQNAVVITDSALRRADQYASSWIIKHEIGHIKHGDNILMLAAAIIAGIASAIFITCALPILPAIVMDILVSVIAVSIISQICERRADNFANQHATDEELLGARRYIYAEMNYNITQRSVGWNTLYYSEKGDAYFDFFYPSWSNRLAKVEAELINRDLFMPDLTDSEEIQSLKYHLWHSRAQSAERRANNQFMNLI